MCMQMYPALYRATISHIVGSDRLAATSFTICAPALRAASATWGFMVSIDIRTSGQRAAISLITGNTLVISSSSGTGSAPGRVDSPPTSRISAPAAIICAARSTAVLVFSHLLSG